MRCLNNNNVVSDSLSPYPGDSIEPWIGTIPDDCKIVSLGKIASISTGSTPTTKNQEYFDGDVVWYTPSDLGFSINLTDSERHLSSFALSDNGIHLNKSGSTVLVCIGATVGKIGHSTVDFYTNQQITSLYPNKYVLPKMLTYSIMAGVDYLKSNALYTTLPIINNSYLSNFKIPVHPLSIQKDIIDYLDKQCSLIDSQIELVEASIRKFEEIKQSIVFKAVTKGIDSEIPTKYSGILWIGDIPFNWSVKRIRNVFDVTLGKMLTSSPESEDSTLEHYLCSANVKSSGLEGELRTMWFTSSEKEQLLLKAGDCVVSEGGNAGTPMIFEEQDYPCFIQNAVHRIRSKSGDLVANKFLFFWLSFVKSSGYIDQISNKATIMHYTKKKVENTPLAIPSHSDISSIVNYLDTQCSMIDSQIEFLNTFIKKLEEAKKSLIYEYITGKRQISKEV